MEDQSFLTHRLFWWSLSRHHYSIPRVITSSRRRQSLIQILKRNHMKRIYTFAQSMLRGYRARPLKAWHRKLHRVQLRSYLLVVSPEWACDAREQRDSFYTCLNHYTDEVTVAAYCQSGVDRIYQGVQQEVKLFNHTMRIGLNVYHLRGGKEACQTWSHLEEIF